MHVTERKTREISPEKGMDQRLCNNLRSACVNMFLIIECRWRFTYQIKLWSKLVLF